MSIRPYTRKVQYYETDMMGIVHHANYIHWMEEARIDFLDQLGFPYARLEAEGVISPVRSIALQYHRPCAFGDTIRVEVSVEAFNGVVLTIAYRMCRSDDDAVICAGRSEHVFLKKAGGFVRMRRDMPEFCAALEAQIPAKDTEE